MDWHPVISLQQQTPDNDFISFQMYVLHFGHFYKNRKNWGLTPGQMMTRWPGDPDVKDDPNDPLTRWPNDPVPRLCLTRHVSSVKGSTEQRGEHLCDDTTWRMSLQMCS